MYAFFCVVLCFICKDSETSRLIPRPRTPTKCFGGFTGSEVHVRWVPSHHGMARPQVADGGKASIYGA